MRRLKDLVPSSRVRQETFSAPENESAVSSSAQKKAQSTDFDSKEDVNSLGDRGKIPEPFVPTKKNWLSVD